MWGTLDSKYFMNLSIFRLQLSFNLFTTILFFERTVLGI